MSGTTIARATSPRGEVVLSRRDHDAALELRVNGVFVMDAAETASERTLAELAVARIMSAREKTSDPPVPVSVLVGGLGLGCTLHALARCPLVDQIVVAELEGALIDWHRAGLVPLTAELLGDPGVTLLEGDVREIVGAQPADTLDALILDVDNGPGFLVYDDNAAVYETPFLVTCRRALVDKGCLAVWSADEAQGLDDALRHVFGTVDHHETDVLLGTRREKYHIYVACKGVPDVEPCPAP